MTEQSENVHPLTAAIRRGYALGQDGKTEEARAIFLAVWADANSSGDLYHACGAAHQLGVLDPTPMDEKLRWNLEALRIADAMEEVSDHWYCSMYLALGYAYYHLNQREQAAEAYKRAGASLSPDDDSRYARETREAIARGLRSLDAGPPR